MDMKSSTKAAQIRESDEPVDTMIPNGVPSATYVSKVAESGHVRGVRNKVSTDRVIVDGLGLV
jgi:hypothetical protein